MSSLIEKVKQEVNIAQVVERLGFTINHDNKILCPFHNEKTPSLSLERNNNYFCCFACGEKGDAIHFVALLKGISQFEAAKLIAEMFGVSEPEWQGNRRVDTKPITNNTVARDGFVAPKPQAIVISPEARKRHAEFIRKCADRVNTKLDYLKTERGFTDDTIARFKLGYDPVKDGITIPYPPELEYQITRLFNPPDPKKKYDKPPSKSWGNEPIFNAATLFDGGTVFIVESQLCAISIIQCGGMAVALGGIAGINHLLREIEAKNRDCVFVVALDNDDVGESGTVKLTAGLKKLGARFIEYNVAGKCKDPNALLVEDADTLKANIQAAITAAENAPEPQAELSQEGTKTESKATAVKELLKQDIQDPAAVFSDEYIDALCYAKTQLPAEYALFKLKAKAAKVPMRDMENTVTQFARKNKTQESSAEKPLDLGRDLGGATAPKAWTVSLGSGVRKLVITRDSEHEIIACPDAVVITARLANLDDGKERLELSFFKDGVWKRVVGMRTQVYSKNSILAFGDDGLHITSETAKDLVGYLSEYEIANKNVIPLKKSIARIGWIRAAEFFPFATSEEIVFEESEGSQIFRNLKEQGDYAEWKKLMVKLRKNPFARFMTSASFASPLLCKMDARAFVIHIWHDSQSGKSAVCHFSLSHLKRRKVLIIRDLRPHRKVRLSST